MFENPRRGRQARNFTTNFPKILDLKSSSEQIFFRKLSLGALTFASESTVIAEARTEWLVYTWERFAPLDMIFIMSPSLFTPSGLFSYHTMSSVVNLAFGFWKNPGQEGFNLDTYNLRLAMHHRLLQCYKALFLAEGLLVSPPGWFFVASSWVITAYSRPFASLVNLKLSRRRSRCTSLPRLHQYRET